jgi:hypothetical protein
MGQPSLLRKLLSALSLAIFDIDGSAWHQLRVEEQV